MHSSILSKNSHLPYFLNLSLSRAFVSFDMKINYLLKFRATCGGFGRFDNKNNN